MCDKFKKLVSKLHKNKLEELNNEISQKQVAGENSKQIQMGTVIFNQGISEERVRNIFSEMIPQAISNYSQEAYEIANKRIQEFESIIVPKILEADEMMSAFSEPAFQMLLRKAQQTAAITDRLNDYSLLAELIMCHVKKGDDRKNRIGITKAVEIVDDIDNDALCALTVAFAIQKFCTTVGDICEGLQVLNRLYEKIIYMPLPQGKEWLDHLDILGAVRINSFGHLKSFKEYYSLVLNGYVCVGISTISEEYHDAIKELAAVDIDNSILVNNELLDGYVRLNISCKSAIKNLQMNQNGISRPINLSEVKVLEEIWDLYSKDGDLLKNVQDSFICLWDSFDALKQLRLWWESIPTSFDITKVGEVLAYTNAKRCDPGLPDLLL